MSAIERVSDRWGSEISQPTLKGKLSFEDSIQMLINRCMTCLEEEFEINVSRLQSSIPVAWIDDEFNEDLEQTKSTVSYWKFKQWCGVNVGTPEEPIGGSPYQVTEEIINWQAVFNTILNLYNRRNLLIARERVEVVTDVEE